MRSNVRKVLDLIDRDEAVKQIVAENVSRLELDRLVCFHRVGETRTDAMLVMMELLNELS